MESVDIRLRTGHLRVFLLLQNFIQMAAQPSKGESCRKDMDDYTFRRCASMLSVVLTVRRLFAFQVVGQVLQLQQHKSVLS